MVLKVGYCQYLDDNNYLGVDLAFYDRLHESNQGEGYFSPTWCVLREEGDGSIAVSHPAAVDQTIKNLE